MKHLSGIYTIGCLKNNKLYVGCSIDILDRWKYHRRVLRHKKHHNRLLQKDWNLYGEENFQFEVLEECDPQFLLSTEIYWINMLNTRELGYNLCTVCIGGISHKNRIIILDGDKRVIGKFESCQDAHRKLGISPVGCSQARRRYINKTSGLYVRSLEDYEEKGLEEGIIFNKYTTSFGYNAEDAIIETDVKVKFSKNFEETAYRGTDFEEFFELIHVKSSGKPIFAPIIV